MKVINLKKYENRKLYAPSGEVLDKGTYVNLKEVADLIKQGNTINVIDKVTNMDITKEVLRKILLDNVSLSTESLLGIIRG